MACIGESAFPRCTPLYAAPEVMQALDHNRDIVVQPSQDIWALGVMAYETIVGEPLFPRGTLSNVVYQCAAGAQQYPWGARARGAARGVAALAAARGRWCHASRASRRSGQAHRSSSSSPCA